MHFINHLLGEPFYLHLARSGKAFHEACDGCKSWHICLVQIMENVKEEEKSEQGKYMACIQVVGNEEKIDTLMPRQITISEIESR